MTKIQIFEPRFNDDELEEEFQNFFTKYALKPLFTDEHRAAGISVTWADARSVINPGGSYHNTLKEFADLIAIENDNKNKSFNEAMFKILHDSKSFQSFMRKIRSVIRYIATIDEKHMFNMWNIVWYDKSVSYTL